MEGKSVCKRELTRITKELLNNADRVIKKAISEMNVSDSKALNSLDFIVDYAEKRLLTCAQQVPKSALFAYVEKYVHETAGPFVRQQVERMHEQTDSDAESQYQELVELCVRNILESSDYEALKKGLNHGIAEVAASTLHYRTDDNDFEDARMNLEDSSWSLCSEESNGLTDGDTSSISSDCTTGCYWEMLSPQRLGDLADGLDSRNPPSVRYDSLKSLSSLPIAEIATFDNWPYLKMQLRSTVTTNTEDALFEHGLRFLLKMLQSSSSFCILEGYTILVDSMHSIFETTLYHLHHSSSSLCDLQDYRRVLQMCAIINAFQKVVPLYWIRFPEKHSQSIVEFTVRYILDFTADDDGFHDTGSKSVPYKRQDRMVLPLSVLAVVDPVAKWFENWMKGEYGRNLVLNEFQSHSDIIPSLVHRCIFCFDLIRISGEESSTEALSAHSRCTKTNSGDASLVDYCWLLHAVNILGTLLQSSKGRILFDTQLRLFRMTYCGFLEQMLGAMVNTCRSVESSSCSCSCLAKSIAKIFTNMIQQESSCSDSFANRRLLTTLIGTLKQWTDRSQNQISLSVSLELHLWDHLLDVLLHFFESSVGLDIFFGSPPEEKAAIMTITSFCENLLMVPDDADLACGKTLKLVKTKMVKICCRIFSSHQGAEYLLNTQLLHKFAEEWEAMLRESELTPVPGKSCSVDKQLVNCASEWIEEIGAISCTPLGLNALYKADLLQDVLNWAEKQLREKEQMSSLTVSVRLMLSQVASSCNIYHHLADYMSSTVDFIAEILWKTLELGYMDKSVGNIVPQSEEQLGMLTSQMLNDLACILPPCASIRALLPAISIPEVESTTSDSVPNLIRLVDCGVKGSSLHPEFICEIGLRLLSLLCTSLDVWLHLQSRYFLKEALLQSQQLSLDEDARPIIDNLFLLRNYLLVKVLEIGGESEKVLPLGLTNQDCLVDECLEKWPAVISAEVPRKYLLQLPPLSPPPSSEIESFLRETSMQSLDSDWLVYCREVYRGCLTNGNVELRSVWFGNLLYYALEALVKTSNRATVEELLHKSNRNISKTVEFTDLPDSLQLGSQLAISYGCRLGLLTDNRAATEDFIKLLVALEEDTSMEFNWTTATSFLLMNGNSEQTVKFRKNMKALSFDKYVNGCKNVKLATTSGTTSHSWFTFCRNVEVVLHGDLPLIANALKRSGLSVGQICQPWLSQTFWNILDWEEICNYYGLCLLMGEDFHIYYVVAVFRHLQTDIVKYANEGNIAIFFRESRLDGFCTKDYLPFMDHLESKYRGVLLRTFDT